MVRKVVFPNPPAGPSGRPRSRPGKTSESVDTEAVGRPLYNQAQTKTPRPDHIDFQALRLLWRETHGG